MVSSGLLLWIQNGLALHEEVSVLDYKVNIMLFNCVITREIFFVLLGK